MRNVEGTAGSVANGNLAAIGALLSNVDSDTVVETQIVNELRHVLSVDLGLLLVETRACRELVGIPIRGRPRDTHPLRAHELRERVRCGGSLVRRPKNIDHPPDRVKLSEAPYAIGVRAEDFKEHVLPLQCGSSATAGWSTRREHANDAVAGLLRR